MPGQPVGYRLGCVVAVGWVVVAVGVDADGWVDGADGNRVSGDGTADPVIQRLPLKPTCCSGNSLLCWSTCVELLFGSQNCSVMTSG